jgi:hypothetical protein
VLGSRRPLMGLDDLWRVQLALALLALFLTLVVGSLVTLLSYVAWRWSLSKLVKRQAVATARLLSVPALGFAGLPVAYTLGLLTSFPGALAVAALLLVLALALAALVHAAFRDESIRHLSGDRELAETVVALDEWERAAWLREAAGLALPSFTGTTKHRTLKRAATVAVVWMIPLVLFHIVRS